MELVHDRIKSVGLKAKDIVDMTSGYVSMNLASQWVNSDRTGRKLSKVTQQLLLRLCDEFEVKAKYSKKKEKPTIPTEPSPDTVEPEQPSKSVHDNLADWMIADEPVKETQVFTEVTLKNTTAKFPTQENNFSRKGNVIVVMFRKGRGEFVLHDLNVTHVTFNQGGVDVNVIGKFSDFAGTCEITYSN